MTNLWLEMCCFINTKNKDEIITRQELIKYLDKIGILGKWSDGKIFIRSLDTYRRYLTKAGYLKDGGKLGFYKLDYNIPTTLSMNQIRRQAYNK